MFGKSVLTRVALNSNGVKHVIPTTSSAKKLTMDSSDVTKVSKNEKLSSGSVALRKGTGGRSSFSGTVVTVFGASGLLGHSVVNRLGKIGSQIIIPYRADPYKVKDLKVCGDLGQVLFYPFYLRDEESIYKAVKYSNVVINLIGKDNETPSFHFDEVHVDGARAIARCCREAGVQRLIHVSALNCTPDPTPVVTKTGSRFLKSKFYGEVAVREEFPDAIIFRPAEIFGNEDRFMKYWTSSWRQSRFYTHIWNKGKGVYKQPVYLSDVGQGIVNAIYDPEVTGKTVDAVGPKRYELYDIVDYFLRIIQHDASDGYSIQDMRRRPLFWLKVFLTELYRKNPNHGFCWDKIERESVSDILSPENLTLEDLGVILTPIETIAKFELKNFRRMNYYDDDYGEFDEPEPPRCVPI